MHDSVRPGLCDPHMTKTSFATAKEVFYDWDKGIWLSGMPA
jgi:hypothetical protein